MKIDLHAPDVVAGFGVEGESPECGSDEDTCQACTACDRGRSGGCRACRGMGEIDAGPERIL